MSCLPSLSDEMWMCVPGETAGTAAAGTEGTEGTAGTAGTPRGAGGATWANAGCRLTPGNTNAASVSAATAANPARAPAESVFIGTPAIR